LLLFYAEPTLQAIFPEAVNAASKVSPSCFPVNLFCRITSRPFCRRVKPLKQFDGFAKSAQSNKACPYDVVNSETSTNIIYILLQIAKKINPFSINVLLFLKMKKSYRCLAKNKLPARFC